MDNSVNVLISARHIHLSQRDAAILFGPDTVLTPVPGTQGKKQYPAIERVRAEGPKSAFPKVAIMLPLYKDFTQMEISLTDARALGIDAPIRMSKDVAGSPGLKLAGPKGEVELDCGVIVAKRHVHAPEAWAKERGLVQNQIVKLELKSDQRSLILDDVVLRIEKGLQRVVAHIDVDEANAAGLTGPSTGTLLY